MTIYAYMAATLQGQLLDRLYPLLLTLVARSPGFEQNLEVFSLAVAEGVDDLLEAGLGVVLGVGEQLLDLSDRRAHVLVVVDRQVGHSLNLPGQDQESSFTKCFKTFVGALQSKA